MKICSCYFNLGILCLYLIFNTSSYAQNNESLIEVAYKEADSLYKLKDFNASEKKLHQLIKSIGDKKADVDIQQKLYNLLGLINYNSQKLDSSNYYYKKSLDFLKYTSETSLEKNYTSGVIKNAMALNMFNTGKTENSILTLKEAISELYHYTYNVSDSDKKLVAVKKRLTVIDNLAGFYRGVGENERAINLATYSYEQKQKILPENDNGLIISQLILGHLHLIARNYEDAGDLLDKGLINIEKIPFAKSYAYLVRASIYENVNDLENAKNYYELCEAVYRESFNGNYSRTFLDGIIEMSNFYTKLDMNDKALSLAKEGYNFTQEKTYENDLLRFFQTQNLAGIYFKIQDYDNALKYSEDALSFFDSRHLQMNSLLDSIQNETRKPRSLLIKSKSEYFLNKENNVGDLKRILSLTEKALEIVETKRNIIKTPFDLETLLIDHNDLISFRKQLFLDLYNKTQDKSYLIDLVGLHESSLYNRIRSRLNLKKVAFSNVPNAVISRERELKEDMQSSLSSSDASIDSFFSSNEKWTFFLDSLKQNYPKYYKMRFATIEEPLGNLQNNIPDQTTIVRYLFIENDLYAFVVTKAEKNIYKLNFESVKNHIIELAKNQSDVSETSVKYFELYQQLWQPFKANVTTDNIIIIPDGQLFNLSFEILTPTKINSFNELAINSLMAKHNISYNYSLLLLNENRKTVDYSNSFVAFAPEFNDKMKEGYKISITDSIAIDKTYLSLLPQPFSVDLVKEYSNLFKGVSFINENASKTIFTNEANEHKIIHIGTHAESNNVSPELSRLIFAKNNSDEDNSLYTYEIYNQNLNSNLAILTACETGKPSYQSGEGMISLAHAFNYAGSESILTSLWKIDEQSSTQIIKLFYDNISKGLSKNKALQQAKLSYIATAKGRTIAPQYWAGLVLIGDASPIDMQTSSNLIFWILGICIVILLMVLIRKKKRT